MLKKTAWKDRGHGRRQVPIGRASPLLNGPVERKGSVVKIRVLQKLGAVGYW